MNRKLWIGLLVILALTTAIILTQTNKIGHQKDSYRIGVFQVVRHPVLDAMADAFEKRLQADLSGKKVSFDRLVADGDAGKTEQMAAKFATDGYDLVYVIGTN